MEMVAWPKSSWTNFEWTPFLSSKVAQVCRRSWKRLLGSPARSRRGLKERLWRLWRLMGVPTTEQNTRLLSCHLVPTIVLSSSCLWRCLLKTSTAPSVSVTFLRLLGLLGVVKVGPSLAAESVRLTERDLALRSTSSHLSPRSSPCLNPVVTAKT